jgi:hypothetical protein
MCGLVGKIFQQYFGEGAHTLDELFKVYSYPRRKNLGVFLRLVKNASSLPPIAMVGTLPKSTLRRHYCMSVHFLQQNRGKTF